eukprot:gene18095-biopygen18637
MNEALAEFHEWATGNRLAAEPAKTQLMMCASRKSRKEGEYMCKMGCHTIKPAETIKVLGVLLDDRLSWEVHNAAAAGKASGIARSVARGTNFLRASDRASLIQALAHPHLDYCQTALAHPSAAARKSIERGYNRTARIAARMPRSEPARKRLGWLASEERRSVASEIMAAKVWNTGEPKCLRELLPEEDRRRTGTSRADKRGEIECCPAGRIGKKAFSNWAP